MTYGVSSLWPISALSPTSKRLPNVPIRLSHVIHLGLLSDFLGKLPFQVKLNSGYRSYLVNRAIPGASSTSQHTNGLAADLSPVDRVLGPLVPGGANRRFATWLWAHRAEFPELDQVIWYESTRHTHVGICPDPGATGCISGAPRAEFLVKKAGGSYQHWTPNAVDLQGMPVLAPVITALAPRIQSPDLATMLATTALAGAVGIVGFLGARHYGWIDWPRQN